MRNFRYLTILSLLLISCPACKDDVDYEEQRDAGGKLLSNAVQDARDYFETYVTEVDLSEEMAGLYPGNFAPDWSKAVVAADGSSVCVNVPIVSDVYYEGSYMITYDSAGVQKKGAPYTAFGQKLLVVKEPDKEYGCYLITIIPDKDNVTRSSNIAANMYNNGDRNTKFSGTALFTILGNGNYPVAAKRYLNGECYDVTSLWLKSDYRQFEKELNALLGLKDIYAWAKTMNKKTVTTTEVREEHLADGSILITTIVTTTTIPDKSDEQPKKTEEPLKDDYPEYKPTTDFKGAPSPDAAAAVAASRETAWREGSQGADWIAYQQAMERIRAQQQNKSKPAGTATVVGAGTTATQSIGRDYTPTPGGGDILSGGRAEADFLKILTGVGTQPANSVVCIPYSWAYANRLYGGNKTPEYFKNFIDVYSNKKIENTGGVSPELLNSIFFETFTFRTNSSLVDKDYRTIIGANCIVMVSIPLTPFEVDGLYQTGMFDEAVASLMPERGLIQFPDGVVLRPTHAILIVGCKKNGDVIFMDSRRSKLQEVSPGHLLEDKYKYVISGIWN